MNKKYHLGIETKVRTNHFNNDGSVHYETVVKWSKGYNSIKELLAAAASYLENFNLADNQRVVIRKY